MNKRRYQWLKNKMHRKEIPNYGQYKQFAKENGIPPEPQHIENINQLRDARRQLEEKERIIHQLRIIAGVCMSVLVVCIILWRLK